MELFSFGTTWDPSFLISNFTQEKLAEDAEVWWVAEDAEAEDTRKGNPRSRRQPSVCPRTVPTGTYRQVPCRTMCHPGPVKYILWPNSLSDMRTAI